MFVSVIIAAGGKGERLGANRPKQFLALGGRTVLQHSIDAFASSGLVNEIVVVLPAPVGTDAVVPSPLVRTVEGGLRRQDSVARGFDAVSPTADVVLVHDAARPLVSRETIRRTIDAAAGAGAAIAASRATDTVKRARAGETGPVVHATVPRDEVWLAETPQGFRREVLERAVALGRGGVDATDEAALAERLGTAVALVESVGPNFKITTESDWQRARAIVEETGVTVPPLRIGLGYDLHRFEEGRPLILGGVAVPYDRGLTGHSDADAIAHALTDAVLGAANEGDIGRLFPDTDPAWKGADSLMMLEAAVARVRAAGYGVVNVDVVVIAERPKIGPHVPAIRARLAPILGCAESAISIKGKTNETVDATGRGEALAVHAVALLAGRAG